MVALALHQERSPVVVGALSCATLLAVLSVVVVPTSVRHLGRPDASPWARLIAVVGATLIVAIGGALTAILSAGAKP